MTDAALALCPTHSIQKQQMAPCAGLRLFKLDRSVCRRRLVPRRALLPCVVVQERDCGVLHNARVFTRSVTPLPHQLRECVTHANVSDNTCAQAWPDSDHWVDCWDRSLALGALAESGGAFHALRRAYAPVG